MRKTYRFSVDAIPLYPHIKLTRERFPRVLATRLIRDDVAEYFGPFLNRTNARILIDFLNRVFRLRSCEIPVDGSFNYPCTMYYKRRCVAPCVADLCTEKEYAEIVELVRVFLADDRERFLALLASGMEAASASLDFEAAAEWRDIQDAAEEYWTNARTLPWVGDASDTIAARHADDGIEIFLVTQRRRRVLGEQTYSFPHGNTADIPDAIAEVIEQFYTLHAPREIRVSHVPARRRELGELLQKRHGRRVPIVLLTENNQKLSTGIAVRRSAAELEVNRSVPIVSAADIAAELKKIFSLATRHRRITAIDASHISGTDHVAAAVTWDDGKTASGPGDHMISDTASETAALASLVSRRYAYPQTAELVLVDGGRAQLNAAAAALPAGSRVELISAVKPPGRHSEISHFLTANGRRIEFDPASSPMLLLQRLRDQAHDLANALHREIRDFANVYDWISILPSLREPERQRLNAAFATRAKLVAAGHAELARVLGEERAAVAIQDIAGYREGTNPRVRPLVVPVTLQDHAGAAEDLRPIENIRKKRGRPR